MIPFKSKIPASRLNFWVNIVLYIKTSILEVSMIKKIIVILIFCIFIPVFTPIGWISAQDGISTGAVSYSEEDTTDYYRAVFAHYLAVIPDPDPTGPDYSVNCAISISNVCAIPEGSGLEIYSLGSDKTRPTSGGFAIFLYDRDGTVYSFSSKSVNRYLDGHLIGAGLNEDGTLDPGQTFTVNLQEILAAVQGVYPQDVEQFVGYGWILSEFDCLAGTYSNTIYGLGFTQAFELKPAMGQGGQFGGIMLPVN